MLKITSNLISNLAYLDGYIVFKALHAVEERKILIFKAFWAFFDFTYTLPRGKRFEKLNYNY